jgi:hypothetical protein
VPETAALSAQSSHTRTSWIVIGTQPPVRTFCSDALDHSIVPTSMRPRIRLLRIDAILSPSSGPLNSLRRTANAVLATSTSATPMTMSHQRKRRGADVLTGVPESSTVPRRAFACAGSRLRVRGAFHRGHVGATPLYSK